MNPNDEPTAPEAPRRDEPPLEFRPRDQRGEESGWVTFGKGLLILLALVAGAVLLLFGTCLVMLR